MKKKYKALLLIITIVLFLKIDIVFAAKELVCIYKGGTQNSPTMLVQDAEGNFTVKYNYYGDGTNKNDKDWYNASADHKVTLVFDDTNSYKNGELTSCPPYVQHPAFTAYKLEFHDKKGVFRLDYSLIEEYEGTLDENNYKQSFDKKDYSEEINNTTWIAKCPYYDDNGTLDATLYFNRDKYIMVPENSLTHKITADFSLYDLLEVYDRRGKCPTLYGDYNCYANIGSTFCYSEYALERSYSNSDQVKPGTDSEINDPNTSINNPTLDDPCSSLLGSATCESGENCEPAFYIQAVFNVMKYVAIILLIVLSSMDFLGAVTSSDDGAMKKAMNKCIKRLIICVIIFFVPTILEYIFTWVKVYTPSTCGIK